jgi:selenocysteine-specific elongation factor
MLVATAGHIDHGKTSLVRALTGVETDRLPEERARGISIDLGFAYWTVEGRTIGFVDVPGHERFVRNMLAGVSAIDFAMLVVAADDGVMPQSIEHVQILDLLGVARGVVVLTKVDRVGRERIDEVSAQVRALLASTVLANFPVFEVSTVERTGIEALSAALIEAQRTETSRRATGRNFRLAIDRAFSVPGTGTVVTGTVQDGPLDAGAHLCLSASGREVRARGLQTGGHEVSAIGPGERCALNLAGAEVADVKRGDWLLVPGMVAPTRRIEARLHLLPGESHGLKHNAAVHVHLGTADVLARVLIPGQAGLKPGETGMVTLLLEHPVCTFNGDRFIVRDQSARRTLGGGRVVDPQVSNDRRDQAHRARASAALESFEPAAALAGLLAIDGHEVDIVRFERSFNLEPAYARTLYEQANALVFGRSRPVALPAAAIEALREAIVAALGEFHRKQADAPGMAVRALKAEVAPGLSIETFLAVQKELVEQRRIESGGNLLKLPGHVAGTRTADRALWERLLPKLKERGVVPLTTRELADELRTGEATVKALLYRRRAEGEVWRITDERFLPREIVAQLAASAALLMNKSEGKGFTAAQYRDVVGCGRTLAIQILEFFDGIGVTRRSTDLRKMLPDYELIVGLAAPIIAERPPNNPAQPAPKQKTNPGPGSPQRPSRPTRS